MHELALMESLVETVEAQAGGTRVTTVRLEVGRLTCVVADALQFCFEVCARGTRLEGAALEIIDVPPRARCRSCATEIAAETAYDVCSCGSANLDVLAGDELRIREVEVQDVRNVRMWK